MNGMGGYSIKRWRYGYVSWLHGDLSVAVILDLTMGQFSVMLGPATACIYLWPQS